MRKILIRFDDMCPTMDYEEFNKAIEVLDRYNLTALLGVIPDCRDPELMLDNEHDNFWDYMKELESRGYKLAMHGYIHKYDIHYKVKKRKGLNSEFAAHSYDIQYKKIKDGKNILLNHNIKTDTFFAPSHSYDTNTIKALSSNGFKYMSDGYSFKPIKHGNTICIPCRSSGVPKIGKTGYYTAVFHPHEWTRLDKAEGYNALVELCDKYHDDVVGFDEYVRRKPGNYTVQKINGNIYKFYLDDIKPILSYVKHKVLHM